MLNVCAGVVKEEADHADADEDEGTADPRESSIGEVQNSRFTLGQWFSRQKTCVDMLGQEELPCSTADRDGAGRFDLGRRGELRRLAESAGLC